MINGNRTATQRDNSDVLFAVFAAVVAFWCLLALTAGLFLHWPAIVLGCLAAAAAAGTVTSTVIFRLIHRQHRY